MLVSLRKFCAIWFVMLLLIKPLVVFSWDSESQEKGGIFHMEVAVDSEAFDLNGTSDFMITPSSLSIYLKTDDDGRCAIHLLNMKKGPEVGSYKAGVSDSVRTSIVCVFERLEPKERTISQKGSLIINEISEDVIKGEVDISLEGGISKKKYHLKGEFESINVPTNLTF